MTNIISPPRQIVSLFEWNTYIYIYILFMMRLYWYVGKKETKAMCLMRHKLYDGEMVAIVFLSFTVVEVFT